MYVFAVASLLFLALAFFAVGQAGATRNGAQTAADAAALAAAQESRDEFETDLISRLLEPGYLDEIFNGTPMGTFNGCSAASYFLAQNGAGLGAGGCSWASGGRWGFTVHAETPMGDSILEGTDDVAKAQATAVVRPRCSFEPAPDAPEQPEGEEQPDGEEEPAEEEPPSPGELHCEGTSISIDPGHLDLLPDMADLFTVRLAQD